MPDRNVSTASHASAVRMRRNVRREQLIVMVCGSPGTGKSTLINNLAGERIFTNVGAPQAASAAAEALIEPKIEIVAHTVSLDDDDGTRIAFTAVDVSNFGAATDNTTDTDEVVAYIEQKYDEVLAEESRIRRNPRFHDARVHACIYLVFPSVRGLSALDVAALRKLGPLVNVILAMGRADSLTSAERALAKQALMRDVELHQLQIFKFHEDDVASSNIENDELRRGSSNGAISQMSDLNSGSNEDFDLESARIRAAVPFALICSTEYDESRNAPVKTCNLPHGEVSVLNEEVSDLSLLRDALLYVFRTSLQDNTKENLYELYRTRKLTDGRAASVSNAAAAGTGTNANGLGIAGSQPSGSAELPGGQGVKDSNRGSVLDAEELALHANRIREEQLRREAEELREQERRVHEEIEAQRAALEARERELRELEEQLRQRKTEAAAQQASLTQQAFKEPQGKLPAPPDLPKRSSSRSPSTNNMPTFAAKAAAVASEMSSSPPGNTTAAASVSSTTGHKHDLPTPDHSAPTSSASKEGVAGVSVAKPTVQVQAERVEHTERTSSARTGPVLRS